MRYSLAKQFCSALVIMAGLSVAGAEGSSVTVPKPPQPQAAGFKMGEARRPDGATLTLDSYSLRLQGRPWTPVMGEFHYSRYPADEWREELLKVKAGGIDIVATYVFWIHHEEIEGEWDWSGRRSLRQFIECCDEVGLKALVRCGPWCHGEVRNGGQPDWLLKKGWKLRSDDPGYLERVRLLYAQIADQLSDLLWKDGGPVIGIQFENEYGGPASHLLTLKRLGREAGLDVPIYTRTGWPELATPMPFGEMVPLYGVYAEGFWDREITPMPGRYWAGFQFSRLRTDANIANEILGRHTVQDAADVARYPYLTCEIGGGMMNSYHRRILVFPEDIDSTTLVKIGSGSTSPGYYMYHGGVNPEGKRTTLMESQATGYWNDLPTKNYDFQTALGQYGQVRPQYHSLRRLHLFLDEWGSGLAGMPASLPDKRPSGKDDLTTLRWAVRSDGRAGYVFVNNYERLREMPPKPRVQFTLQLTNRTITFPATPVTVPADSRFFWPFNLDLGYDVELAWATAQPVSAVEDGNVRTVFFAEIPGIKAAFAFRPETDVKVRSGKVVQESDQTMVRNIKPGRRAAILAAQPGGKTVRIVLLNDADSLALWKGRWQGAHRMFLTEAGLVLDGGKLRLTSTERDDLNVGVFPSPNALACAGKSVRGSSDGVFERFSPRKPKDVFASATFEQVLEAGPPRKIPLGKIDTPVAAAPVDPDFDKAAVWRIQLPENLDLKTDPLLRLEYVGDVARLTLDGKLMDDDFYNGNVWEVGLRRHAPDILDGYLRLAILPLRKDAPIYLAKEAQPDFGSQDSIVRLRRVEIIPRYQLELTVP